MALQTKDFSATGKSSGGGITYTYILRVTENSAGIVNGKPVSNITVVAILKQSYSGVAFSNWSTTVTASINGKQIFSDTKKRELSGTAEHIYHTWTGNIEHNADGELSITVGGELWQTSPESYSPPTLTITESSSNAMVLTPVAAATACSAPITFTASPACFNGSVALVWSGARGGTNNDITGYRVQCNVSPDGQNWGSWKTIWSNNQESVTFFESYLAGQGITLVRGDHIRFRIITMGEAGSDYYSGYKYSNVVRKLPASIHIKGEPHFAYIKSGDRMSEYIPCIYMNGEWQNSP